jgi:hypothetical protein
MMIEVRSRMEVMMRLLIPAVFSISLAACVVEQDVTSTDTQSVETHNRIAANRIAANRIAANRIAANRIAANRIAANRLRLADDADQLINTPEGREVLTYIIGCALPDTETLVGTDSGGTQWEFNGEIGLAPDWIDNPLSEDGQHWVSACLFARVNENNVAVDVSLRGPSSALDTTATERAIWSVEEGAFYGMYFQPDSVPIATSPPWGPWFACSGRNNLVAHTARQRDCATPDPAHPGLTLCGFYYAGDCGNYSAIVTQKTACRAQSSALSGGYYEDCAEQPTFAQDPHDGHHGDHDGEHHDHERDDRSRGDAGDEHGDDNHGDHGDHGDHHDEVLDEVITTYVQP